MCLGPPEDAHAQREDTQTDMLARTPPRVHTGHLDAGSAELRDRVQVCSDDARLDGAHETVKAVRPNADVNVREGPWLVVYGLHTFGQL